MIVELILGATVGAPVGMLVQSMFVAGKLEDLADEAEDWKEKFKDAVRDIADLCSERDALKQRVKDMQPMHDLGVRRHQTMQAEKRARKEARKAKREARAA